MLRAAPPKPKQSSELGFPPWGTALALAVIALLGAGAFWLSRTSRGDR
ncbi:MAG: hypothetical protein ABI232_11055 [Jatrophihabitantaceae bacterium]